jgi:hypothetical protein
LFETDVSGLIMGTIFKGSDVQEEAMGPIYSPETSVSKHFTTCNKTRRWKNSVKSPRKLNTYGKPINNYPNCSRCKCEMVNKRGLYGVQNLFRRWVITPIQKATKLSKFMNTVQHRLYKNMLLLHIPNQNPENKLTFFFVTLL